MLSLMVSQVTVPKGKQRNIWTMAKPENPLVSCAVWLIWIHLKFVAYTFSICSSHFPITSLAPKATFFSLQMDSSSRRFLLGSSACRSLTCSSRSVWACGVFWVFCFLSKLIRLYGIPLATGRLMTTPFKIGPPTCKSPADTFSCGERNQGSLLLRPSSRSCTAKALATSKKM